MGIVLDTIKKSVLIIERTITKDCDSGIDCDMEPESEFKGMLDFIARDNGIVSSDDFETNNNAE